MSNALQVFFGRVFEWTQEFFLNVYQFAEFTAMWQGSPILARIEREEMAGQLEEERNKVCI